MCIRWMDSEKLKGGMVVDGAFRIALPAKDVNLLCGPPKASNSAADAMASSACWSAGWRASCES